jgi:outer membrane biosynthesis protein TonB
MRNGTILSGLFHSAILSVMVFGLPTFREPPEHSVVPVELVIIDDRPEDKPEPDQKPETVAEQPAPEPEAPKQMANVPPAAPEPEPEPAPEPMPPPPVAKPEPEPEPEKVVKAPPPPPRRRPELRIAEPKESQKEPKPEVDALASILRNVERLKDSPVQRQQQTAKAPTEGPPARRVSAFERNEMARAIQQQLRRCWRLDPGAMEAEDMVIEIRVLLNPDGSVRQTVIMDVARMVQDGYFRSAAENAKRAIDVCSPFKLPPRKYDVWRELTLRFNPREMFGT